MARETSQKSNELPLSREGTKPSRFSRSKDELAGPQRIDNLHFLTAQLV